MLRKASMTVAGVLVIALVLAACGGEDEPSPREQAGAAAERAYDTAFEDCMHDERRAYWLDRAGLAEGIPGNRTVEEAVESLPIESEPDGDLILEEMREVCDSVAEEAGEEARRDIRRGEPDE